MKVNDNLYDEFDCEITLENLISVTDDTTGTKTSTSRIVVRKDCDTPDTPTTPTTPPEYPHTGPAEIITAIIAVTALAVGGTYWYRSQKDLKKASAGAKAHDATIKNDNAKETKSEAKSEKDDK